MAEQRQWCRLERNLRMSSCSAPPAERFRASSFGRSRRGRVPTARRAAHPGKGHRCVPQLRFLRVPSRVTPRRLRSCPERHCRQRRNPARPGRVSVGHALSGVPCWPTTSEPIIRRSQVQIPGFGRQATMLRPLSSQPARLGFVCAMAIGLRCGASTRGLRGVVARAGGRSGRAECAGSGHCHCQRDAAG